MINKEYWIKVNPFAWTSFNPRERLEQFLNGYEAEQKQVIEYAKRKNCTEEQILRLVAKMDKLCEAVLSSKSRCASSAITGGSGFNVARAERANKANHEKEGTYYYFLENYKKLIDRLTRPKETQTDKKAVWLEKIAKLEAWHLVMKQANWIIKHRNTDEGRIQALTEELGLKEDLAKTLVLGDFIGNKGFAPYKLSLNLKEIKRLKEQVALIDKLADKLEGFDFEGGKVEFDAEDIRWNVFFDCKPDDETRARLKKNGFKWSPKRTAWTRLSKTMSKTRLETILKGA